MNKNVIFFAAVAALSSGVAMAQSGDYRGERNERADRYQQQRTEQLRQQDGNAYSRERGDDRGAYRSEHRGDYRGDYRGDHGGDRYDRRDSRDFRRHDGYNVYSRYDGGQRHRWQRGGYLPSEYRGGSYVVTDWHRRQGLYAPQRGYQWVQSGNDYLLVAIATGLIANVLLN